MTERVQTSELTDAWRDLTPFHVRLIVTFIEQRVEEDNFDFALYIEGRLYVRLLEAIADGQLTGVAAKAAIDAALTTQDLPIHEPLPGVDEDDDVVLVSLPVGVVEGDPQQ